MIRTFSGQLYSLLGLGAVAATVALQLPAQAEPRLFQNVGGTEFINLDRSGLDVFESIGLSLSAVNSSSEPPPGFDVALDLLPPSSDPTVRGTQFFFTVDDETSEFAFLGDREEFSGSLLFDVDTALLNLGPTLELGNFSAIYLPTGEVFLQDNLSTGLPLFFPSIEGGDFSIDFATSTSLYENVDFLVTPQFSDFLLQAGASRSVAETRIASGDLFRQFAPVEETAEQVPEADLLWALMLFGTGAICFKAKLKRSSKASCVIA